jgi:hypothetical protein
MNQLSPRNFRSLLFAAACAVALCILLIKSNPSVPIALLSIIIVSLCLQVAFLRRDLANLQDKLNPGSKN